MGSPAQLHHRSPTGGRGGDSESWIGIASEALWNSGDLDCLRSYFLWGEGEGEGEGKGEAIECNFGVLLR